jgi:hypothetical protein
LTILAEYADSLFGEDRPPPIPHLSGELGVGKTAIARAYRAAHPLVACAFVELGSTVSLATLILRDLRGEAQRLTGRRATSLAQEITKQLARLSMTVNTSGEVGVSLAPVVDDQRSDATEKALLLVTDIAALIADACASPTIIMIDEVACATARDAEVVVLLRDLAGDRLPLGQVYVGNLGAARILGQRSYALRSFDHVDVPPLDESDVVELFRTIGARIGLSWPDASLDVVIPVAKGNPYVAKEIVKAASRFAPGGDVTAATAGAAIDAVKEDLAAHLHKGHWDHASSDARRLLLARAQGRRDQVTDFIQTAWLDRRSPEEAAIESLVENETIDINWSQRTIRILVPLLEDYVRDMSRR